MGRRGQRRRRMSLEEFERTASEALEGIPPELREKIDNLMVWVEEEPRPEDFEKVGLGRDETLFGLYEGVPLTDRGVHYGLAMPDRIRIFKGPIERACRSRRQILEQIRQTVIHEVGHHFGISDEMMKGRS